LKWHPFFNAELLSALKKDTMESTTCKGTPYFVKLSIVFRQAQHCFLTSLVFFLRGEKVENITNSTCFGFVKFGVGTFLASYACEFFVLDIKNF